MSRRDEIRDHLHKVIPQTEVASSDYCVLIGHQAWLLSELDRKDAALVFYRDEWNGDADCVLIGPGPNDYESRGFVTIEPSDELLADKGERARKALEGSDD